MKQSEVKALFTYSQGKLIWKTNMGKNLVQGTEAGCQDKGRYRAVRVHGKRYYIHRLVFLFHHGYLPRYVDHINQIKSDNRIENLRECNQSQNSINVNKPKLKNAIKYRGVTWHTRNKSNPWVASLRINGKKTYLGAFKTEIEAAIAYDTKAREVHKEFAILNFP